MTVRSARPSVHTRIGLFAVAGLLATGLVIFAPGRAVACSCVPPEPMRGYAGDPSKLIFAGSIAPAAGPGVTVVVERWFQGGRGPIVDLDGAGFGEQGAACQVARPAAGSRWIYVAVIPNPGQQPQVNLCTPRGRLDSPDGQAMLADAVAVFGAGVPAVASESAQPDPLASVVDSLGTAGPILVLTGLAAAAVFGSAWVVARRRSL